MQMLMHVRQVIYSLNSEYVVNTKQIVQVSTHTHTRTYKNIERERHIHIYIYIYVYIYIICQRIDRNPMSAHEGGQSRCLQSQPHAPSGPCPLPRHGQFLVLAQNVLRHRPGDIQLFDKTNPKDPESNLAGKNKSEAY